MKSCAIQRGIVSGKFHERGKLTCWVRSSEALRDQVANDSNSGIHLCTFFDPGAVAKAIDGLPDTLAADESNWTLLYDYDGKPAWIWPHGQIPPFNLCASADGDRRGVGFSFGFDLTATGVSNDPAGAQPAPRGTFAPIVEAAWVWKRRKKVA